MTVGIDKTLGQNLYQMVTFIPAGRKFTKLLENRNGVQRGQ